MEMPLKTLAHVARYLKQTKMKSDAEKEWLRNHTAAKAIAPGGLLLHNLPLSLTEAEVVKRKMEAQNVSMTKLMSNARTQYDIVANAGRQRMMNKRLNILTKIGKKQQDVPRGLGKNPRIAGCRADPGPVRVNRKTPARQAHMPMHLPSNFRRRD